MTGRFLWLTSALVAAPLTTPLQSQATPEVGGLLRPGMQLVYYANGEAQPTWTVDSIVMIPAPRPDSRCAVIHIRRQPAQAQPDQTRLCLARDTLFNWDHDRQDWRPGRPAGPGMRLSLTRRTGGSVEYETDSVSVDHISGHVIPVLLTTVTTRDSLGRPVRRLRERYALGLATATGGTFEIPDPGRTGAWQPQQVFELRAIAQP
jgi:hypothetical protein